VADLLQDKDRRWTYADYKQLPDELRVEIIDGVLYDMSAAPVRRHQLISVRLERVLDPIALARGCELYHAPFDIRLPQAEPVLVVGNDRRHTADDGNVSTVVQPDIVVVCDKSILDDAGCSDAPELVIEILSPSTSYKDQSKKLELYERHGVLEYWIVNPEAAWVMVYLRAAPADARFAKPEYYRRDESIPVELLGGLAAGSVVKLEAVFV